MGAIAGHSLAHRCHSSGPLRGFPDNSDDAATAAASARAKAMAETKATEELSKADDAKRRILIAQVEAAEAVAAAEKDKAHDRSVWLAIGAVFGASSGTRIVILPARQV